MRKILFGFAIATIVATNCAAMQQGLGTNLGNVKASLLEFKEKLGDLSVMVGRLQNALAHNPIEELIEKINTYADEKDEKTKLKIISEITYLLNNSKFDINAKNKNKQTPLRIAIIRKLPNVVEMLLDKGADVNAIVELEYFGEEGSPLFLVITKGTYDSHEADNTIVKTILNHVPKDAIESYVNAVMTSEQRKGYTPLHLAAQNDQADIAKTLLKYGADVNAKVQDELGCPWKRGYTPLHIAAKNGNYDCVKILLDGGADVNAKDAQGITALVVATEQTEALPHHKPKDFKKIIALLKRKMAEQKP